MTWSKLYPYYEMFRLVGKASVVIAHGGPGSLIMPLQIGKVPIVVPRRHEFDEHISNYQVEFCRAVAERQGNIIVVENAEQIGKTIEKYNAIVAGITSGWVSNNCC